jgi:hypothetical protein
MWYESYISLEEATALVLMGPYLIENGYCNECLGKRV